MLFIKARLKMTGAGLLLNVSISLLGLILANSWLLLLCDDDDDDVIMFINPPYMFNLFIDGLG